MLARLRRIAQVSTAGILIAGVVLRITVRDEIDGLAILFYATPWPVLAVLGFAAAVLWIPKRKRFALGCAAAGATAAVLWVLGSYERSPRANGRHDLRVVSWSAEHAKKDLPAIIEKARSFEADILGITETESTEPADAERWRAAFPGHTVETLPGHMLFITRGEMIGTLSGSLAGRGNFNLVRLKFGDRPVQVVLQRRVDHPA